MIAGCIADASDATRIIVPAVWRTDSALERMRGLLARPPLKPREGLLIVPCASVHTAFMSYALDIVFMAKDGTVRKVVDHLAPWRSAACFGARFTLELLEGQAARLGIVAGRQLSFYEAANT